MLRAWPGLFMVAVMASGAVASTDMGTEAQQAEGKELYDKFCSQCHGDTGDGKGYAANRVKPAPRDFTSGKYKIRTTPSGNMPTNDDMVKVIKEGLPYTSMPGWPQFTDSQIMSIVYYLKTFSGDFQNEEKNQGPINIPEPPSITPESIERGRVVYEQNGCLACHGNAGRGDGLSAPTMVDEWGDHLWPADMTYRWTYRGGPTRQDIFRTFSTGVNGTPMPSYYDVIEESDRWDLVNYIYSLNPSDTPDYSELLMVPFVEDEIDLANADELFANAPMARFPVVGQIVETGRNFYPAITAVEVEAVYNQKEIAFRVRWHDRIADRTGHNDPTLPVPPWDEDNDFGGDAGGDEGGFWGDAVEEEGGEEDIWGDAVEEEGGDDFWGEEEDDSGSGFSDAVALQFPSSAPTGIRKPYFIFGDVQNSVDLWFVDVARGMVDQYIGRGSQALELSEADDIDVQVDYQEGRWTALFKRSLKGQGGISFAEDSFAPIAFSVWDGFNRERGNKRSLSAWFYLYLEPQQKISPVGPMIRAGLIALFVELLLVFIIRKKYMPGRQKSEVPVGAVPERG